MSELIRHGQITTALDGQRVFRLDTSQCDGCRGCRAGSADALNLAVLTPTSSVRDGPAAIVWQGRELTRTVLVTMGVPLFAALLTALLCRLIAPTLADGWVALYVVLALVCTATLIAKNLRPNPHLVHLVAKPFEHH